MSNTNSWNTEKKRTRLTAIYLTADERDLVIGALDVVTKTIGNGMLTSGMEATAFARSYTCKRIQQCRDLFRDKATTAGQPCASCAARQD